MENLPISTFPSNRSPSIRDCDQVASTQIRHGESAAADKPVFFPFPFPPYDIQEDFMKTLYGVLENGEVGIFESPTGTVSGNGNGY